MMHDNTAERRTTKPSVPLVQLDAAGRPMWKNFGADVYQYEPELEAVWRAARQTIRPYYSAGGITIYHGDCRDILPRLTERAALLWTDSAYEIESGGNTTKRMMGGIFDPNVYDNSGALFPTVPFAEWVPLAYAALRVDADAVLMSNDKNLRDCLNAMSVAGLGLHNVLLWSKQNKTPNRWGMKSVEFMPYGWKGRARVLNDCGMGQVFYDRNPTGDKRHTTEKPASLPYKHILNMTDPGDLVLDPFGGSFSTMVAAKRAGRRGIAIELSEAMCESGARWLDSITVDGSEDQQFMVFDTEAQAALFEEAA